MLILRVRSVQTKTMSKFILHNPVTVLCIICCLFDTGLTIFGEISLHDTLFKDHSLSSWMRFFDGERQHINKFYEYINSTEPGSFAFSPVCTKLNFLVLYVGAKDKTAEEIRTAYDFPYSTVDLAVFCNGLHSRLKMYDSIVLNFTSRVYYNKNFNVKDRFLRNLADSFFTNGESIDFGDSDVATQWIDDWITENTDNTMNVHFNATDLSYKTKLVVLNTMRFIAMWSTEAIGIKMLPFYIEENTTVETQFMNLHSIKTMHGRVREHNSTVIQIPFKGSDFHMLIIQPDHYDSLSDVEDALIQHGLDKFDKHTTECVASVSLPVFTVSSELLLEEPHKQLGVLRVFQKGVADLTNIAPNIAADRVKQTLHMSARETGVQILVSSSVNIDSTKVLTEPSSKTITDILQNVPAYLKSKAATFVEDMWHNIYKDIKSLGPDSKRNDKSSETVVTEKGIELMLNKPFIFFIREHELRNVLFLGRYLGPQVKRST